MDFGVGSGRKRHIMLPTASREAVGSVSLQVWPTPICRKTNHLCSERRFRRKNLQVGTFFAFSGLLQASPGGRLQRPSEGVKLAPPIIFTASWRHLGFRTHREKTGLLVDHSSLNKQTIQCSIRCPWRWKRAPHRDAGGDCLHSAGSQRCGALTAAEVCTLTCKTTS